MQVKSIAISLIVIALGTAWLLNTMHIISGVNWIWTLGLALAGLLILATNGINKLTIVTGPLLIIASIFSVLRQTNHIELDHEVPILVILMGVLMLIAQIAPVPAPGWLQAPQRK
jgi:hypothetical protein